MKIRFDWDPITGINPRFASASRPSNGPHDASCPCLACMEARNTAMHSRYVINDWGDVHLSRGEREQMERSRIARMKEEHRQEHERERGGRSR
jgi:hypothetical protein